MLILIDHFPCIEFHFGIWLTWLRIEGSKVIVKEENESISIWIFIWNNVEH